MEGKGAGNKLMSLLWHQRKRATAFVLAFAMTFVNIANNVTIAFAAEEVQTEMSHNYAEAVFQLDTEDIKEAAQSAVNDGIKLDQDTISFSDLDGANAAAKYDRIFKAGKDVYEFFPSIGGEIPDGAELRTFIRTNGSGELNGEEEVLFLFINASSDMDFIFSVNINGVQTSGLKVAAHSAKLEEKAEKPSAGQGAGGGSGSSPSGNTAPEDTTVSPDNTEAAEEESSAEDTSGNLETPDAGDEEGGDIASDETDEVKVPDGDDGNLSDEAGDTGNSDENDSVNAPDENGNADVSDGDHNAEGTDEGGNADTSDEGSNSGSADEGSDAGTADEGNSGDISDEGGSSDSSGQEDSADTSDEGSDGEVSDEGGSADTFDEEKEDSAPGEATARISRHEVPVLTAANDMQDGELINDLEGQDSDARETEDSEDTYVEEDIDDTVIEVMGSLKGEALDSVILDDSYTARLYITTIGELPVEVETISTPSNAKNKAELVIHYVTPSEETGEDISIKEDKVVSKYTVGDSVDLDQYIAAVDGYLFSEFDTTAELSSSSILLDEYNEVTIRYESEQMMPMTMAMVWRLGADTVDVVYNFEGIEGGVEPETPDTIEVGRISDNAPAIEGFAFVNATVEGTPIVFIGKYNDIIYYSVDGDSAIELDHDEIVLNYKKLAQNYKVTFAYDTSKGYVEGEKTVEGEIGETLNYRFTVTPNKDCEVKAIMVNGNSYSADSDGICTVDHVSEDLSVEVEFAERRSFAVVKSMKTSYGTSGAEFTGNDSVSYSDTWIGNIDVYGSSYELNYLLINGTFIDIPTTKNETKNKNIDGMQVSLNKIGSTSEYTITIKNVNQDLKIEAYAIAKQKYEIAFIQTEGVEAYYWDESENKLVNVTAGDVIPFIQPQWWESKKVAVFYAKTLPGYKAGFSSDGKGFSIIDSIDKNKYGGKEQAKAIGCTQEFHYTSGGNTYNRTVYLASTPIEYTVSYDLNEGSGNIYDSNIYTVVEDSNTVAVTDKEPTRKNYVFAGWELQNSGNGLIYSANDRFGINEETISYASDNTFTFKAKWLSAETNLARYTVRHYKEQVNGSYVEETSSTKRLTGIINKTAFAIPQDFEGYVLNEDHKDAKPNGVITKDNNLELRLYYDLSDYTVNYVALEHGSIQGETLQNLKYGQTTSSVTAVPEDGYKFLRWNDYRSSASRTDVVTGNKIYTASFGKDETKWNSIKYVSDGNPSNMPADQSDVKAGSSQKVSSSRPVREGFRFEGWETDDTTVDADQNFIMPANDVTFTAKWSELKYRVSYYENRGDKEFDRDVIYDEKRYAAGDTTAALGAYSVHDGSGKHILVGWSTDVKWPNSGIVNKYEDYQKYLKDSRFVAFDEILTFGNSDIKLYAIWASEKVIENTKYSVTFTHGSNGSFNEGAETVFNEIPHGTTWTESGVKEPVPVPDRGYQFDGWYDADGGKITSFPDEITQDLTFEARFTEAAQVTITYNAEEGGTVTVPLETVAPVSGTVQGSTAQPDKDYYFTGWYSKNDGRIVSSDLHYTPGKVNGVYEENTYTAHFAKKTAVTITAASDSKTYDGTPLTKHEWAVSGTADKLNISGLTAEGTITDYVPGGVENKLVEKDGEKITITDENGADVTDRYSVTLVSGRLTIIRKSVAINVADAEKVFGTEDPVFEGTISGLVKDGDLGTVKYVRAEEDKNKNNVGDQISIVAEFNANPNYKVTANSGTLTIIPAGSNSVNAAGGTYDYDGQGHGLSKASASVSDSVLWYKSENREWSVEAPSFTEAGSYDVWVMAKHANYEDTDPVKAVVTILPREITLSVNSLSKQYGQQDPAFTVTRTGDLVNDKDLGTISYKRAIGFEKVELAGTVIPMYPTFAPNANYKVTVRPGTLTIEKAGGNRINASDLEVYYDGEKHSITASAEIDGSTVYYRDSAGNWSTELPEYTNAGTYSITAYAENPNYEATEEITVTLTIKKIPLTITAENKGKTYGEADPELTALVEGIVLDGEITSSVVEGETLNYDLSRQSGENAGTYDITVNLGENPNYDITAVPGILTISRKNAGVMIKAEKTGKIYGEDDPELRAVVEGVIGEDRLVYTLSREEGDSVGVYPITVNFNEEDNPNYQITAENSIFTINPKPITIQADNKTAVYGEAIPELTATVGETAYGETLSYTLSRELGTDAGEYVIYVQAPQEENPNYDITAVNGKLVITARSQNVSIIPVDTGKVYGEGDPVLEATVTGIINNDTLDYQLIRTPGEDAGEYEISVVLGENPNYQITLGTGTFTISPKEVTITPDNKTITYGAPEQELTAVVSGVEDGDQLVYTLRREPGTDAGTYDISVNAEAGMNKNYKIIRNFGTYTIDKKTVTVKPADKTKVYGSEDPALTADAAGVINGDKLNYTLSRESGENVGEYKITVTPGTNKNYTIVPEEGIFTITPKSAGVKITAVDKTKVYGSKDPELTADISGLVDGDDLDYTLTREAGESVGEYGIIVNLGQNDNYQIETEPAKFTITAKPVTVIARNASKTYGELDPQLQADITGLVNGDILDYTVSRTAGENAGDYPISVDVTPDPNYDIKTGGATFTILPREVDVLISADNLTKVYGEEDPELKATVEGLADGEKLNYTLSRQPGEDVGTYEVTVNLGENPNYTVNTQKGSFLITKKDVTVTADNKSKTYGEQDPELTAQTEGRVGNDSIEYSLARENGESAGSYKISVLVKEEDNPNYNVITVPGTFTINPKSVGVTIKPVDNDKVYGTENDPELKADVKGLIGGDTLDYTLSRTPGETVGSYDIVVKLGQNPNYEVTAYKGIFKILPKPVTVKIDDKTKVYGEKDPEFTSFVSGLVGADKLNYTLVRQLGEDAGDYAIEAELGENPNYRVTADDGKLTITPKSVDVLVKADDLRKEYGSEDPEFTATVTGILENDKLDFTLGRQQGENVGTYKITVTLGENKNYSVTTEDGEFTIYKKSVMVTPDNKEKTYGENDPELTAVIDGLAGNDTLNFTLGREAGNDVGTYEISVTVEESANPNYDVKAETGILKINKKDARIEAVSASKIYGEEDPELKANITGALDGDNLVYQIQRDPGEDAKEYPINITVKPEENPNYNVTVQNGLFTILKKSTDVLIQADNQFKTYGEEDPELTATVTGTVNGETLNYSLQRVPGNDVGTYDIEVILGSNPNYEIETQSGAFLIKPKSVTIRADEKRKTYGETDPELTATVTGLVGNDTLNYTLSRKEGNNVNTYPIYVTLGTNTNYRVDKEDGLFYIEPKEVEVKADDKTKVYGEADPVLTATVTGVINEEHVQFSLVRELGNSVGSYKIKAVPGMNGNYKLTVVDGILEITPKAAGVAAVDKEKVYGEEDPELTAVVTGLISGDSLDYTLTRGAGDDAGTYPIQVILGDNKNYTVEAQNAVFTIKRKDAVITVDSAVKTYGDKDPAFTGNVTGLVKPEDLGTIQYVRAAEDSAKESAGDSIKLTAEYAENNNYNVEVVDGTLTIAASSDNAVAVTGRTVEYDGKNYGLEKAEALRSGSTLYYSTDGTSYSTEEPVFTEAGTYTVYVKAENKNYEETKAVSGTVIINKRPITITASSAGKTYDGTALTNAEAGLTSGSLAPGQILSAITVTGSQTEVGNSENIPDKAVITANGKDVTSNYEITYINGILSITASGSNGDNTPGGGSDSGSGGNSGGGGGNSGTTPGRGNGGDTGNGPGSTTINPTEVPLAGLPNDITTGENILIDDGEIPLAALPKTGNQAGMNAVLAMLSGMLLAAYLTISKKKDEES